MATTKRQVAELLRELADLEYKAAKAEEHDWMRFARQQTAYAYQQAAWAVLGDASVLKRELKRLQEGAER